jgi:cell division protein FtsB
MKPNKKITSILIIFGLIIGTVVLFNSLRREAVKGSDLDKEMERLQKEVENLETRNSALVNLTKDLSDLEFLESEARVKMGMKLPGETVVVINRATTTPKMAAAGEGGGALIWENPKKWYQYFFNNTDAHR